MTDITHDNIFTNNDTVPRLRRILDEGPALPDRATDHEIAPYVPPPERTGSELISDKAIGILRQTGQHVLDQFKPMHDELDQAEQMVIKAMSDGEENIRAQMRIFEAAAKIVMQTKSQLAEAVLPLAALSNAK